MSALENDLDAIFALERQVARYFEIFGPMTRAGFTEFVASPHKGEVAPPGLVALTWTMQIQHEDRARVEAEIRAESGIEGFQITEIGPDGKLHPAADSPIYVFVRYIEPYAPNRGVVGLNLMAEPARRAAINASWTSHEPHMTAPVSLLGGEVMGHLGVLLAWPVFDPEAHRDGPTWDDFSGAIVGVLSVSELVKPALGGLLESGHVWLRDITDSQAPVTMLGEEVAQSWAAYSFAFAGRTWELRSRPSQAWISRNRSDTPLVVLLSGLLSTALLIAYLQRRSREARALHESRERLRKVLEHASDAVVGVDAEGHIASWNTAASRMFGLNHETALGQPFGPLVSLREGEALCPGNRVGLRATGERFPADLSLSQPDGPDAPMRFAFLRDLSARERAEEEARHLHRLEGIGQLTGQLAHDFNNILGVIAGGLEMVETRVGDDPKTRRWLDTSLRAVHRGAAITRSLLALARRRAPDAGLHDLNLVVESTLQLARATVGRQVTLRSTLDASELIAHLDSAALTNVLLNLLNNARDALADAPRKEILVSTLRVTLKDGPPPLGPVAVIAVRDTGVGLSDEVKGRAFEPFFTTKDEGKGTGLGLSMVADFVQSVRGRVSLENNEDEGATVRLFLPLEPETAAAAAATEARRLAALRSLSLLETSPEEAFDEVARRAAECCGAQMALVSLVDEHRQWFKARYHVDLTETPRAAAFCDHAIRAEQPLVVPDASQDPRFSGHQLVVGPVHLRFYAGLAVREPGGAAIGTLCVLDSEPRQLSHEQLDGLRGLARRLERVIAARGDADASPLDADPEVTASRGRVLVAEDEAALLDVTQQWLEDAGFEVILASDGQAALARAAEQPFDLLVTDVIMPGLDGVELARILQQRHPGLPVIFCSGHTERAGEDLPGPLLEKPCRRADLVALVESMMPTARRVEPASPHAAPASP